MNIYEIRKKVPFEEIDYLQLKSILKDYAQPRNKIRNLLKARDLIRVKKGIYIFGTNAALGSYCAEHLANLIYGPSAISLEYALSFYGLIPERVEEVTSITLRRNKIFKTPVGRFSYSYLAANKYFLGIKRIDISGRSVLIASPEKALCDVLFLSSDHIPSYDDFLDHLYENLRVDKAEIKKFDLSLIKELSWHYQDPNVNFLLDHVKGVK